MGWSTIRCKHCNVELDGCRGLHGWWMHRGTLSEFCADGVTLAVPLTPQDLEQARAAEARHCAGCDVVMPPHDFARGRPPRYCSTECRGRAQYRRKLAADKARSAATPAGEVA